MQLVLISQNLSSSHATFPSNAKLLLKSQNLSWNHKTSLHVTQSPYKPRNLTHIIFSRRTAPVQDIKHLNNNINTNINQHQHFEYCIFISETLEIILNNISFVWTVCLPESACYLLFVQLKANSVSMIYLPGNWVYNAAGSVWRG